MYTEIILTLRSILAMRCKVKHTSVSASTVKGRLFLQRCHNMDRNTQTVMHLLVSNLKCAMQPHLCLHHYEQLPANTLHGDAMVKCRAQTDATQ